MQEVRLELTTYDALQNSILMKNQRIDAQEHQIEQMKSEHEKEIDTMAKEGKVRVIEKPFSVMAMLLARRKPKVTYKGFDDVKAEVYEHFKQGLFDEELDKFKKEQLDGLIKQVNERGEKINDLKDEIERLKGRSLWERIRNK